MPTKRPSRLKQYLKHAWQEARENFDWKAILKPLTAAVAGAVVALLGLAQESPRKAFIALIGGLFAGLFSLLLSFLGNLAGAPKDIRRRFVVPAGEFGSAVIGKVQIRASDIMQQEAATIANLIRRYLEGQSPHGGHREEAQLREEVKRSIKYFHFRAEKDPWISRKSRKRSLRLYQEISGSEDLEFILERCLEFVKMRPSF